MIAKCGKDARLLLTFMIAPRTLEDDWSIILLEV